MSRVVVVVFLIFALLVPAAAFAQEPHPLRTFVAENADSPELVTRVQSSGAKRMGKVLLGAGLGALAGALHAQATGGDLGREIAIGAVAGGAIAFAVTKIQDRKLAKREEVAAREGYDPSQGYRSEVRSIMVSPSVVRAGETLTVNVSYWALGPGEKEKVGMARFAGISTSGAYLRGFSFDPTPMPFGKGGGEFETTMEVQLPPEISPGTYSVVWLLDGNLVTANREVSFVVAG